MATLGCGDHQGFIYDKGGTSIAYELDKIQRVDWERVRDDVSDANVTVSARANCCRDLGDLQTGYHELHLYRDGLKVWEGPITRLDYDNAAVSLYASDILWAAQKTVLATGYNKAHPNIAKGGWVMNWLLKDQTFAKNGDPWNANNRVHWVQGSDDASTSAAVKAWSVTTWADFDKFAEDRGMDYTVVGRDIYFWDTHLQWRTILPELTGEHLQGGLAVGEYGSEFATRVIVTNGNGYASMATAPAYAIARWGYIDQLITTTNEAAGNEVPTNEEKQAWLEQAQSALSSAFPAPVRVRVPDNSALLPTAPFGINDLVAGAWIHVVSDDLCRDVDQWHKLDRVNVHQESGNEVVTITTSAAPEHVVPL